MLHAKLSAPSLLILRKAPWLPASPVIERRTAAADLAVVEMSSWFTVVVALLRFCSPGGSSGKTASSCGLV